MNELPLNKSTTIKCANWLEINFSTQIQKAIKDTPFTENLIYAIALQETAYKWHLWIDDYIPSIILERCVFDASGDMAETSRSAFPQNLASFRAKYDEEFISMLIEEGNLQRAMPQVGNSNGWKPSFTLLYKGYGIFQYDLQAVVTDESFFREKKWYSFEDCLDRCLKELHSKYKGNLHDTIKHYNGSGAAAENYAKNVEQFIDWIV